MTDARLKGEWLTAAAHDGLSDAAYRVLHNGLMHSAEQGTDGFIATRELRFLYPGPIDPAILDEIAIAGFWEKTPSGYQFIDWAGKLGQSTAVDVEKQREANRQRKRTQRAREKARRDATDDPPRDENTPERATAPETAPQAARAEESQRDTRRDVTVGVGQDRQTPSTYPVPTPQQDPGGDADGTQPRASADPFGLTTPPLAAPELSPFCPDHPNGTTRPCTACGQARKRHRAHTRAESARRGREQRAAAVAREYRIVDGSRVCSNKPHELTAAGTCAHCNVSAADLDPHLIGATA